MKKKTPQEALRAFKLALKDFGVNIRPHILHIDRGNYYAIACYSAFVGLKSSNLFLFIFFSGNEFLGPFKQFCETENIKIIHTNTGLKASIVESVQFRLKLILARVKSFHQSTNGAKFLNQAVKIYNNSTTSGLPNGITPNQAQHHIPEIQLFHLKRRSTHAKKVKGQSRAQRLKIGQKVRLLQKYNIFQRGFSPRFNDSHHTILGVAETAPEVYRVSNDKDTR